jgi:hypothetical protein
MRTISFYQCVSRQSRASSLTGSGRDHYRIDLTENDVNAAGDSRHDGACGDRDKAGHQSVLDQILTAAVFPNSELYDVLDYL